MFSKTSVLAAGAFAASVYAHGAVTGATIDGVYTRGYHIQDYYSKTNGQGLPDSIGWYAENLDNGFVEPNSYGTADIICHKASAPGKLSGTVAAGGKVDFHWDTWPESHIGPILTYVAKCAGDCADAEKASLKWVKIDEAAYDYDAKKWVALDMIANNFTWSVTVPSTLAAGNYVFRHEIIALHGAGSENGAQNYPQCLNIAVTGSGTANPEGVVGTSLYKSTDAGILFSPYQTITDYKIPGPALFGSGSDSGSGSAPAPSSSAAASPVVTATPTAAASSTLVPEVEATSTPVASSTPVAPSSTVIATPTPTSGAGNGSDDGESSTSKPIPSGTTVQDILEWLNYLLKDFTSGNARRHARAF